MAEKSSELENINEPDAVSTLQGARQDNYLDAQSDDYSISTNDTSVSDDVTTDDTEQIRSQIVETRSQMSETIDAIQEKLSIANISEQVKEQVSEQITSVYETAKDSVYGATFGKVGEFMKKAGRELSKTEAGRVAKDNPFPMILIGLGVGLLAYQSAYGSKRPKYSYRYSDEDHEGNERGDYGRGRSNRSTFRSAQEKISGTASSAYGSAAQVADSAYGSVTDAASTAYDGVSGAASSAYEGVSGAASSAYSSVADVAGKTYEKVGDLGSQAREQYDYYIDENPLAIGAVALAVGAAVGLSIPSTRYEGQLMGEARNNLMSKAQEAAGDLVDRVKQVAGEAQKTIGDEVRHAVDETKRTVADQAEKQGLTNAAASGESSDKNDKSDKPKSGASGNTPNAGTKL